MVHHKEFSRLRRLNLMMRLCLLASLLGAAAAEMQLVRQLLRTLRLVQYADKFEDVGYDDADFLMQLNADEAEKVAQTIGMKPGHAHKFVHSLRTTGAPRQLPTQSRATPVSAPVPVKPAPNAGMRVANRTRVPNAENIVFQGSTLKVIAADNVDACSAACDALPACVGWTLLREQKRCSLKADTLPVRAPPRLRAASASNRQHVEAQVLERQTRYTQLARARHPECTANLDENDLVVVNASTLAGSFLMAAHPGRDGVTAALSVDGYWEWRAPAEMMANRAGASVTQLATRPTFVDVGANIGYHSFMFALTGSWDVIAFEPMLHNRGAIEATLCMNPQLRSRVTVIATALGSPNDRGPCVVTTIARNNGNGRLTCGAMTKEMPHHGDCTRMTKPVGRCKDWSKTTCEKGGSYEISRCQHVPLSSLDDALSRARGTGSTYLQVDVMKIDVEGFECSVLQGAHGLFSHNRPRFLHIEATPGSKTNACVRELAAAYNYTLRMVGGTHTPIGQMPGTTLDQNALLFAAP
jgi:FkbM family methyltransferase